MTNHFLKKLIKSKILNDFDIDFTKLSDNITYFHRGIQLSYSFFRMKKTKKLLKLIKSNFKNNIGIQDNINSKLDTYHNNSQWKDDTYHFDYADSENNILVGEKNKDKEIASKILGILNYVRSDNNEPKEMPDYYNKTKNIFRDSQQHKYTKEDFNLIKKLFNSLSLIKEINISSEKYLLKFYKNILGGQGSYSNDSLKTQINKFHLEDRFDNTNILRKHTFRVIGLSLKGDQAIYYFLKIMLENKNIKNIIIYTSKEEIVGFEKQFKDWGITEKTYPNFSILEYTQFYKEIKDLLSDKCSLENYLNRTYPKKNEYDIFSNQATFTFL